MSVMLKRPLSCGDAQPEGEAGRQICPSVHLTSYGESLPCEADEMTGW